MNLNQCDECNIAILSGCTLYRAFDNTYCSNQCLKKMCYDKDNFEQENRKSTRWSYSETDHVINIPIVHRLHTYNQGCCSYMYKISLFGYLYIIISSVSIFGIKTLLNAGYHLPRLI